MPEEEVKAFKNVWDNATCEADVPGKTMEDLFLHFRILFRVNEPAVGATVKWREAYAFYAEVSRRYNLVADLERKETEMNNG